MNKIKIKTAQIHTWKQKQNIHDIFQVRKLWRVFMTKPTHHLEYIPDREYHTYRAVQYIEYKNHLYIYILDREDYEIAYEKKQKWKQEVITSQIQSVQKLGERLKQTKKQLQEQRTNIKNRWIRQVTAEIRENVRTNRTRLVWKRLNQLKQNNVQAKQKNMELRDQEGKLQSTIPKILQIMQTHMKNEHYKTPGQPQIPIIDPKLWKDSHENVQMEIHPNITKERNQSRLQQYLRTHHGASTECQMTQPVTDLEITKAIRSLHNRKSVGNDGITAEVIKQNQKWLIPNIKIILHNCQQSYQMPKQWMKG